MVANGAGLEAGIPLDEVDAPSWMLTEHAGELFPFEEGGDDPHVWMDPTRVAEALPSLADVLADADPDHANEYRRRAREYERELRTLDRELAGRLARVPARDRELVTSHDSLAYFADQYQFDVAATAFPATGAEAEASAEQIHAVEDAVGSRASRRSSPRRVTTPRRCVWSVRRPASKSSTGSSSSPPRAPAATRRCCAATRS